MVYLRRTFLRRYSFIKRFRVKDTWDQLFIIFDGNYQNIRDFAKAIEAREIIHLIDTDDLKVLIDYLRSTVSGKDVIAMRGQIDSLANLPNNLNRLMLIFEVDTTAIYTKKFRDLFSISPLYAPIELTYLVMLLEEFFKGVELEQQSHERPISSIARPSIRKYVKFLPNYSYEKAIHLILDGTPEIINDLAYLLPQQTTENPYSLRELLSLLKQYAKIPETQSIQLYKGEDTGYDHNSVNTQRLWLTLLLDEKSLYSQNFHLAYSELPLYEALNISNIVALLENMLIEWTLETLDK